MRIFLYTVNVSKAYEGVWRAQYAMNVIKMQLNTYWASLAQAASFGTLGFHSQVSPDCGTASSLPQSTVVLQKSREKKKIKHRCTHNFDTATYF